MRWQPSLRTLPPYYRDGLHIEALRANLTRQLAALDFEPQRLLLSFHGMPQRTRELGDPYHDHCRETARLLGEALGREVDVAFQSRFSRAKWLEPATDAILASYPGKGVTRVAVAAPGFSADCLERSRSSGFAAARPSSPPGVSNLPCSNASTICPKGSTMLSALVSRELEGWAAPNLSAAPGETGRDTMARVAIVTGGTRGIGEAISVALKDMGMQVAATYAGNEERARAFSDRTGIASYKWDVARFRSLPGGRRQGRIRARAGRRAGQ